MQPTHSDPYLPLSLPYPVDLDKPVNRQYGLPLYPVGPGDPFATITVPHAPTRTCVVDARVGGTTVPPTPMFDVHTTVHVAVAVTGHEPAPFVRAAVERTWNMYAQDPAGGVAVMSTDGPGSVPAPVHVNGTDGVDRSDADTGSPIE